MMTNAFIQEKVQAQFGELVSNFSEPYGMLTFEVASQHNLKLLTFLFDDEELGFRFMTDLCGVHNPDLKDRELCVVYHLHNLSKNVRIRVKAFIPVADPRIYTATGLFESANWQERETFDFYGILFTGHPNLKRILNVEEMDYFPMRKEFPLEDQSRIDKDDEMFGRGGTLGFGTEKQQGATLAEDDKHNEGAAIV